MSIRFECDTQTILQYDEGIDLHRKLIEDRKYLQIVMIDISVRCIT